METKQATLENIKDTVQAWLDGKVDAKAFDEFLKTSNAKLDELKAEERRRWEDLNWKTMY
jgi:hypothetical protein